MSNQPQKVFVLVHGTFHGAWAFERLTPLLAQEGHPVIARDLPGHGLRARFPRSYLEGQPDPEAFAAEPSPIAQVSLQDCADQVLSIISEVAERMPERQIILVGHSFGGLVLNLVGEAVPHLIGRLVYLSGYMAASGKAANDYLTDVEFASTSLPTPAGDPGATGALRLNPRSSDPAHRAQLKTAFAGDIDDHDWEAVANLLTPDAPAGAHAEPVTTTADRWGAIPRTYISCTGDRAFPVPVQQRFIREADTFTPNNRTDVQEMATSHSPFLSQPDELARILIGL